MRLDYTLQYLAALTTPPRRIRVDLGGPRKAAQKHSKGVYSPDNAGTKAPPWRLTSSAVKCEYMLREIVEITSWKMWTDILFERHRLVSEAFVG